MSEQLQLRRGTATQVASFTGAQGETIVDTTNNRLVVNDGSTAGGWPAAKLSEVITNTRTPVSDANYTALTSDRLVAYTALTAARVVTLPAASAYPTGSRLLVVDEAGVCSATCTITINRIGTDTINGAISAVLSTAHGYLALESNGSSAWTIVDNSTLSMAQQAASAVAITGGTINATTIGATTPAAVSATTLSASSAISGSGFSTYLASPPAIGGTTPAAATFTTLSLARHAVADANYTVAAGISIVAYTAITAARTVTLPAASAFAAGQQLLVVDESGACSATDTITISRAGTDTINGALSATLSSPYAYMALESNGSNAWTIVDNSTLGMAQQAASAVAITGGTINATTIGATTPAAVSATTLSLARHAVADANYTVGAGISIVAYTAITATRTVTLPPASSFAAGQRLTIIDESGSCSSADTITISRAGSDTIDGGTSFVLNAAYAALVLESNGSNAWTIVTPAPNVIATLVGIGTPPDPNNPLSVYGPSALFDGAPGMNVTVNKNGSTNTASFIFEDTFSGRAQIGLNGSDNFSFKVSPNGSIWTTAITLDATTGAATLANLRTAVSDAAYAALVTDRLIAYTAITAARAVTLPAASVYPTGQQLTVVDESGSCSATKTITINRAGSDTINGATSAILSTAYGYLALESNGSNAWTIVDNSTLSLAQQAASAVAITGGTIDNTVLGGTMAAAASFTDLMVNNGIPGNTPGGQGGALYVSAASTVLTAIFDNYSGASGTATATANMVFRQARGTPSSPSALQSGDFIGSFNAKGYNGSAFSGSKGKINFLATENWSGTANGTAIAFQVTLNTTTTSTEAMRIDNTGDVGIGTSAPAQKLDVYGAIAIGGTTAIGSDRSHYLGSYTVSTLPAPGTPGRMVFASNGRMYNGTGTLEGSGSGTGGLVVDNGTTWKIAGTNQTVQA